MTDCVRRHDLCVVGRTVRARPESQDDVSHLDERPPRPLHIRAAATESPGLAMAGQSRTAQLGGV